MMKKSNNAFSYKFFRIYFLGTFFGQNAYRLGVVTQGILIWKLIGTELSLGVGAASLALPMIIFNLFGGVLADRYESRVLLLIVSSLGVLSFVGIALLDFFDYIEFWHVIIFSIFIGIISGIDQVSRVAYFPSLVPKISMKSAVKINTANFSISSVIAPTLAGIVISIFDTYIGFLIAAIGWATMAFSTFFLPNRGVDFYQRSIIFELTTGFRYIYSQKIILILSILLFINMLMNFGWITTLPSYVQRFDGGAKEIGYLFSSCGVGATTGVILSSRLSPGKYYGLLILFSALLFSIMLFFVSLSENLYLSMLLAGLAHFGNGSLYNTTTVAVQIRLPELIRGRVMGIFIITGSVGIIAGLWTGYWASLIGLRFGMMIGPTVIIMLVIIILATQKRIRNLHENPEFD
ncbi:MAG: hypothetical protein CL748_04885 [Chloroflexi bacterium]|nr:hypothetical protein [Chloroflexota bacterium]